MVTNRKQCYWSEGCPGDASGAVSLAADSSAVFTPSAAAPMGRLRSVASSGAGRSDSLIGCEDLVSVAWQPSWFLSWLPGVGENAVAVSGPLSSVLGKREM